MSQCFPNLSLGEPPPHGLSPESPPAPRGGRVDADDASWLDDYEVAELVLVDGVPRLYTRDEIPSDKPLDNNTPTWSPHHVPSLSSSTEGAPPLRPVLDATVPCPTQLADAVPVPVEGQLRPRRRARRAATDSQGVECCRPERRCSDCAAAKRRRAAALHNLTAKKRREKVNQKIKELHQLIPGSRKADNNASVLDEAIVYIRQQQAQAQMMRGMVAGMQASMAAAASAAHMAQFRVGMWAPPSTLLHPSTVLQAFTGNRRVQYNGGPDQQVPSTSGVAAAACPPPASVAPVASPPQQQQQPSRQAKGGSNGGGADMYLSNGGGADK